MLFWETKHIKKNVYQNLMDKALKLSDIVLFSLTTFDEIFPAYILDEIDIPHNVNLKQSDILADSSEQMCYNIKCYKTNYAFLKEYFFRFNSIQELMYLTDIYRIVFVKNNEIFLECMFDDIFVYAEDFADML